MDPSAFEVALPFLLTAGVTMLGSLGCLPVLQRTETEFERITTEAKLPDASQIEEISPENLAAICNWAIDGAAFVAGLLGPGLGLILLFDELGSATVVIYFGVLAVTFGGFFLFLARVPVVGYPTAPTGIRIGRWLIGPRALGPFTPVAELLIAINLILGVALWLFW